MSVTVSVNGAVTTARLAGEIDTYTVPDVRAAFERLTIAPDATVVVDLRDVTFLDSSGLGAIIGLYHRVVAGDARLQARLRRPHPASGQAHAPRPGHRRRRGGRRRCDRRRAGGPGPG